MIEAFYRTHTYLVEHLEAPVRRVLMDEINWDDRLVLKEQGELGKQLFYFNLQKNALGRLIENVYM